MMKSKIFLLVLFIVCFLGSCSGIDKVLPKKNNVICLVDYSNSIDSYTIIKYVNGIELILNKLGPEDRLNVYPIDAASSSNRVALISEDFLKADKFSGTTFNLKLPDSISPPFLKDQESMTFSNALIKKRMQGYLRKILPLIPKRLDSIKKERTMYGGKSDIFSALHELGFNDYDLNGKNINESTISKINSGKVNNNYIVIFSDMIQESVLVDFNKIEFNDRENTRIIDILRTEKMLPNLQNSKVIIFMNNNAKNTSNRKMRKTRDFWTYYFGLSEVNAKENKVYFVTSDNLDNVISLIFE